MAGNAEQLGQVDGQKTQEGLQCFLLISDFTSSQSIRFNDTTNGEVHFAWGMWICFLCPVSLKCYLYFYCSHIKFVQLHASVSLKE